MHRFFVLVGWKGYCVSRGWHGYGVDYGYCVERAQGAGGGGCGGGKEDDLGVETCASTVGWNQEGQCFWRKKMSEAIGDLQYRIQANLKVLVHKLEIYVHNTPSFSYLQVGDR